MNRVTKFHVMFFMVFVACSGLRAGVIFPVDTLKVQTYDCNSGLDVCLPVPIADMLGYTIYHNGVQLSGGMSGCDYDTLITYSYNTLLGQGNSGPYYLDSWNVNGQTHQGMFQNIPELVAMLNAWDTQGGWVQEAATLSIKGGASGSTYSSMEVTVMVNQTPSTIGLNLGLLPQGTEMSFSEGTHQIVAVQNGTGVSDTLTIVVQCLQLPPPSTIYDTIPADGLPYTICLDTSQLDGPVQMVFNACPDQSGTFVAFYVDPISYCVKYQGIACNGTETACMVVCDDAGMCDTTFFVITVDNSLCSAFATKINDTLLLNFSKTVCLDDNQLPGTLVTVENICPDDSGSNVDFDYDENTHCVTYTAFGLELDRACMLLIDEFGNTDTVYFCVLGRLPETGIIIDTILLGQNETYCIDTTELAGNIVSIENICPAFSGEQVEFTPNAVTLCVDAQSLAIGTDTACMVICDSYGVCDTTLVYITVVPDTGNPCAGATPPIAVLDSATTLLNTPVNIEILANDTLGPCLPFTLTVLDLGTGGIGPKHGLTVTNPDMTVDYVPNLDFCGTDSFEYVLCNQNGCDTALVMVKIACVPWDTIIIYNGFSPNGDGVNDFFKIENIEHYPDNEVQVFNRWGLLVLETKGYKNNWDGQYRTLDLPDGTYFYRIKLDAKEEKLYSGYLHLRR